MLVGGCWSSASFLGVVGGRGGGGFLPNSGDDGLSDCSERCVGCEESFDKVGAVVPSEIGSDCGRSFLPDSACFTSGLEFRSLEILSSALLSLGGFKSCLQGCNAPLFCAGLVRIDLSPLILLGRGRGLSWC